jgi:hopanoid biosynthesis associated RND transporter like protein HpnN
MLNTLISRTVVFSARRPWVVIAITTLLCACSAVYISRNFAITTDVATMIQSHEPWAQRDDALARAFPTRDELTLIVVTAPASELADAAADRLAARLATEHALLRDVVQTGSGPFFERNGLLYVPVAQLTSMGARLGSARALVNALAHDPSLRGMSNLLGVSLFAPLETGQFTLGDAAPLFTQTSDVLEEVIAGKPSAFSWRGFAQNGRARGDAISIIEVHPRPNYGNLEAGGDASARIRQLVLEEDLAARFGASVRLTGPIPLSDEEFASVKQGSVTNALATIATVILILWLALRSAKLVVAVFLTLVAGLMITTAVGLVLVGALNMISVAFAVLFVGIGVDFSIQFGVRYRSMRAQHDDLCSALEATAGAIAMPLSLAAAATAASFLSFLPTDYRGLAELGEIAGVGILLVAFPGALTLFPALIALFAPAPGHSVPGFPWLAPLDRFFEHHRKAVLGVSAALVVLGLLLLPRLYFDADPLHLKDPRTESMRTLSALADAPQSGIHDVEVLADSLPDASATAGRLRTLPEVERAITLADLVPEQQDEKIAVIAQIAAGISPVLEQGRAASASDAARVTALRNAAGALANAAIDHPAAGAAEAERLGRVLGQLASGDAALRDRAERAIALPLTIALSQFAASLHPQAIGLATLPPEVKNDWVNGEGRALVEVTPRLTVAEESAPEPALRRFCAAVLAAEPRAVGGPISIFASADTIIRAFFVAAAISLAAISLLLFVALRRWADVARTLIPLLVSALVTLEICAACGIALNFANIIALPLLLGVGVAFKIYYVIAWRNGQTGFLQSGLTQAVVLSAATTATAFGSLWLSHHAGTSSMGELLALSLACTLIGAVLFQPVLMGRPPDSLAPPGGA